MVVPARDEADVLARTLAALANQVDLAGRPLPRSSYEIVVLANNCQDDTAHVARHLAEAYPDLALHVVEAELPANEAHVGSARRLAMDEACRRLVSVGRPRGLIATTDADTVVTPTWLAAMLRETERGVEAVGGRILIDAGERRAMDRRLRSRFLRNVGYYALVDEVAARVDPRPADPWPRHDQFFGANLAVTANAYRRVGGLPVLQTGEDVALGRALRRADIEIRHSPDVRVYTSARLRGRTPAGLAAQLSSWSALADDDDAQRVPSPTTVVERAACRRALRDQWQRARSGNLDCPSEVARLAETIGVFGHWLREVIQRPTTFGVLLDAVEEEATWPGDGDLVDVRAAITRLRAWLAPYRRPGAPPPAFGRHLVGLPFEIPSRHIQAVPVHTPVVSPLAALEEIQAIGRLATPPQVA